MKPATVDAYIAEQDEALQPTLEQLRSIIRAVVPEAEEVVSYMVPCYKLHGMFIGFGVHKGGCSLYAMNTKILGGFDDELKEKGVKISGSTLHFAAGKKLPVMLIKKIVKERAKQNVERSRKSLVSSQKPAGKKAAKKK